ncbi:MAG: DUF1287 domain-containing protein [Maricaulaceae bacterium]
MRRIISLSLLASLLCFAPASFAGNGAGFQPLPEKLVDTAQARTLLDIRYDPKYVKLSYPGGDVSADTGVCTDVIIRTFRDGLRFDFQKAVHEDMKVNFSEYPKNWGLTRADKNIDHRRVPNLEAYLKRQGASLPVTKNAEDYRPGDIVSWRLGGRLPHIGIVSDKTSQWGTPLIIHNVGQGVVEDDLLFNTDIEGHYRFLPRPNMNRSNQSVSKAP